MLSTALLLAGCAPAETDTAPARARVTDGVTIDRSARLDAMPPCTEDQRPEPAPDGDLELLTGLVVPPEATITSVEADGPLVNAEAYVDLTPIEIRQYYQNYLRLKADMIEDEIFEAEALMRSPTHRFYVKAQAICRDASIVFYVLSEEGGGGEVPTPANTQPPDPAGS